MLLPKTLKVDRSLASAINDSAAMQNIPLCYLESLTANPDTAALDKGKY